MIETLNQGRAWAWTGQLDRKIGIIEPGQGREDRKAGKYQHGQDSWDRTSRRGQWGQESKDRTARTAKTGDSGQDSLDCTVGTGWSGHDSKRTTAETGQGYCTVQYNCDRRDWKGQSGHDCWAAQLRQYSRAGQPEQDGQNMTLR
jgi:hypothetical protein